MRVPAILLIFAFLLCLSCREEKKAKAPLSRDQMVSLMLEIYLAEARTTLLPMTKDSSYRLFLARQDSLLRKHGVSDSVLRRSYSYYLDHPDELEVIYDAIIDSLSLQEQRGHGYR